MSFNLTNIIQRLNGGADTTSSTTNRTATASGALQTGDVIVAFAGVNNNSAHNLTVQDNVSTPNTYTQLVDQNNFRGAGIWIAQANSASNGATPVFTLNKGGSNCTVNFYVYIIRGADAAVYEGAGVGNTGTGTTAALTSDSRQYDLDIVFSALVTSNTPTIGLSTAYTTAGATISGSNSAGSGNATQLVIAERATSTASTDSIGFTISSSSGYSIMSVTVKGQTTAPTILSTSSSTPANGSALTITGLNFGGSIGTVTLGGTSLTVTAWSSTSITATVNRGTNAYGTPVNLSITTSTSVTSNTFGGTSIAPQTGWSYVTLTSVNTTASLRITTTPTDLAIGDQIAYETLSGAAVVFLDGTFSVDSTVVSFQFDVWSPGGWGSTMLTTIQSLTAKNMVATNWTSIVPSSDGLKWSNWPAGDKP
jgi:hypothetical protein